MFLFNLYVSGEGALRAGGVLSNMTGRVTRFTSTFHGQACAFEQRAVETGEIRVWHSLQIHFVLRQYFTNDLLNLNVYHCKKHPSKIRKVDLLETVFLGRTRDVTLTWIEVETKSVSLSPTLEVATLTWRLETKQWVDLERGAARVWKHTGPFPWFLSCYSNTFFFFLKKTVYIKF